MIENENEIMKRLKKIRSIAVAGALMLTSISISNSNAQTNKVEHPKKYFMMDVDIFSTTHEVLGQPVPLVKYEFTFKDDRGNLDDVNCIYSGTPSRLEEPRPSGLDGLSRSLSGKAALLNSSGYFMARDPRYYTSSDPKFLFGSQGDSYTTDSEFTVACWFKNRIVNSVDGTNYIFSISSDAASSNILLGLTAGPDGISFLRKNLRSTRANLTYSIPATQIKYDNSQEQWYFVALQQTPFVTRVFLGSKNTGTFQCQYFLTGSLDYSGTLRQLIGTDNPGRYNVTAIDDFMVWNRSLSSTELQDLFLCSKDHTDLETNCFYSPGRGGARYSATTITETTPADPKAEQDSTFLRVFPNPSQSGNFTVTMNVSKDTPADFMLVNTLGQTILTKRTDVTKGSHQFNISSLEIPCTCSGPPSGVYILKVRTNQFTRAVRLVVE